MIIVIGMCTYLIMTVIVPRVLLSVLKRKGDKKAERTLDNLASIDFARTSKRSSLHVIEKAVVYIAMFLGLVMSRNLVTMALLVGVSIVIDWALIELEKNALAFSWTLSIFDRDSKEEDIDKVKAPIGKYDSEVKVKKDECVNYDVEESVIRKEYTDTTRAGNVLPGKTVKEVQVQLGAVAQRLREDSKYLAEYKVFSGVGRSSAKMQRLDIAIRHGNMELIDQIKCGALALDLNLLAVNNQEEYRELERDLPWEQLDINRIREMVQKQAEEAPLQRVKAVMWLDKSSSVVPKLYALHVEFATAVYNDSELYERCYRIIEKFMSQNVKDREGVRKVSTFVTAYKMPVKECVKMVRLQETLDFSVYNGSKYELPKGIVAVKDAGSKLSSRSKDIPLFADNIVKSVNITSVCNEVNELATIYTYVTARQETDKWSRCSRESILLKKDEYSITRIKKIIMDLVSSCNWIVYPNYTFIIRSIDSIDTIHTLSVNTDRFEELMESNDDEFFTKLFNVRGKSVYAVREKIESIQLIYK